MSKFADYLTKQIFIEKDIVTYRLLSRKFGLHVNEAKNVLASFLSSPRAPAEQPYATYIISGERHPQAKPSHSNDTQAPYSSSSVNMDVDSQEPTNAVEEAQEVGGEDVSETAMILVGQGELENTRAHFNLIYAEHIYCLSPSPLQDAGFICTNLAQVYNADAKVVPDASMLLGRIVGSHVQVAAGNAVSVSKTKVEPPSKPGLKKEKITSEPEAQPKLKEEVSRPEKKEANDDDPPPAKSRLSGKLDWSRAKPKGAIESKSAAIEQKSKTKAAAMDVDVVKDTESRLTTTKDTDVRSKPLKARNSLSALDAEPKRGTKRKSALRLESDSDSEAKRSVKAHVKLTRDTKRRSSVDTRASSEDEMTSGQNTPVVRVKGKGKQIPVSDDDEDEVLSSKPNGKGRQPVAKARTKTQEDVPQSLKAMFDIDDDEVTQGSSRLVSSASQPAPGKEQDAQAESKETDVEMDVESDVPAKAPPKRRREKKVIPVGRNGLKKKRTIKQKTFMDDNGYMVTEDYSSYESVDEEKSDALIAHNGRKAKKMTDPSEDAKLSKALLKEPRKGNAKSSGSVASGKSTSGTSKLSAKGSIQTFFNKK